MLKSGQIFVKESEEVTLVIRVHLQISSQDETRPGMKKFLLHVSFILG